VLGLLALTALALRLYHADAQSLWYDEGTSAAPATRTLAQIVRNASNDIHPPLYYLLLAVWTRVLGDGVTALRALSAVLGAFVVLGAAEIARRLWGRAEGLAGGLLAACSPYLVWYSQEVRMYILAAALAVALALVAVDLGTDRRGPRERPWPWVLAVLLAVGALYTHYLAGAIAVLASCAVALACAPRDRRDGIRFLAWWLGAQAVAVAAFLPWLAYAWHTVRDWPALAAPVTPAFVAGEAARTFALGIHPITGSTAWVTLFGAVLVAGVAAGMRGSRRRGTAVAVAWVAVPPAAMCLMSLVRPAWDAKFLIVASPAFELLLGAGAVAVGRALRAALARAGASRLTRPDSDVRPATSVGRAAGVAASVALVAMLLWPRAATLRAMYFDPAYQRDDYRSIAREIDALADPIDAVIVDAPTQVEVLGYYDRGRHTVYPLPLGRPPDRAATLARLDEIGARRRDLYTVLWATDESDPDGLVENWLGDHRIKAFDRWYGNVRLALWAAAREVPPARLDPDRFPMSFGDDEIVLVHLTAGPSTTAPGDVVTIEAWWVADNAEVPPRADYVTFLHLVDAAGRIVVQRDMPPQNGTARTSTWQVLGRGRPGESRLAIETGPNGTTRVEADGEIYRDHLALSLPADVAPGTYRLLLGLYDPTTGTRLPVRRFVENPTEPTLPHRDALEIGSVRVVRRTAP
jgi:mannosyltransferase